MILSRKKILITMAVAACAASQMVQAAGFLGGTLVTPTQYTVHLAAVSFINATTSAVVPFTSTVTDFDIATAAAGGGVGAYGQGISMTPGVYSGMQWTIQRSITITATGSDAGQLCHTAAGLGTAVVSGMTVSLGSTNPAVPTAAEEIAIPNNSTVNAIMLSSGISTLSNGDMQGSATFPTNITIKGTNQPFNLIFGVTNAAEIKTTGVGTCVIVPNIPTVSST